MTHQTFGEKRRAVRRLRQAVTDMRGKLNAAGAGALRDVSLTLPRDVFEDVEWALGRVRVTYQVYDDEGQPTGEWRRERQHMVFTSSAFPQPNLLLKGCPVFTQ